MLEYMRIKAYELGVRFIDLSGNISYDVLPNGPAQGTGEWFQISSSRSKSSWTKIAQA